MVSMQLRTRALGLLLSLGFPLICQATTGELLQLRMEQFQGELERLETENTLETKDITLEEGTELFPDDGTPVETTRVSESVESSGYVTFRIDGVPYVFTDVPVGAWFAPYVRDVAEKGIVSGYKTADGRPLGIFGPERNVTLEELAKMAVVVTGTDTATCPTTTLNKKAAGRWSLPYIACAERDSFAVYADGSVDILRPATRAEVVMTVLQAFGVSLSEDPGSLHFSDVDSSTLFQTAIAKAVRDGIVSGYTDDSGKPTGKFGPSNPVNRAEVAKILSRALQVYSK